MREAILRTLAYFDIFDYSLTALEVWKYLYRPDHDASLGAVLAALQELEEMGTVIRKGGFWMLPLRGEIMKTRCERAAFALRKYRRAKRAVRFIRRLPGIRFVAVCNTLAWNHARDESDIDFFIVTGPGAIWRTRLFTVTPFALAGLRPRRDQERDALCFSFFVTETALDLSPLALEGDDPYLAYWIASLVPLYDPDGLLEAIWDANPWVRTLVPNALPMRVSIERRQEGAFDHRERDSGAFSEALCRAVQMMHFPDNIRAGMNTDHRVVVTDEILKFHENDRREFFRTVFYERCRSLGI